MIEIRMGWLTGRTTNILCSVPLSVVKESENERFCDFYNKIRINPCSSLFSGLC